MQLKNIDILDSRVIIGLFVGGMLPFLFSAMTMSSVSRAAYQMIEEVRRQFRTMPGIMEEKEKPDYKSSLFFLVHKTKKDTPFYRSAQLLSKILLLTQILLNSTLLPVQ